jgi:hypothetical protein
MRQVSGSYYRGDVNEQQLQRVYGTAFFNKKSLKESTSSAWKRRGNATIARWARTLEPVYDHPQVGSGLVLWEPHGAIVRMMLENFIKAELIIRGFQPVFTPHAGATRSLSHEWALPVLPGFAVSRRCTKPIAGGRCCRSPEYPDRRAAEHTGARREEGLAKRPPVFASAIAEVV